MERFVVIPVKTGIQKEVHKSWISAGVYPVLDTGPVCLLGAWRDSLPWRWRSVAIVRPVQGDEKRGMGEDDKTKHIYRFRLNINFSS